MYSLCIEKLLVIRNSNNKHFPHWKNKRKQNSFQTVKREASWENINILCLTVWLPFNRYTKRQKNVIELKLGNFFVVDDNYLITHLYYSYFILSLHEPTTCHSQSFHISIKSINESIERNQSINKLFNKSIWYFGINDNVFINSGIQEIYSRWEKNT